MNGSLSWRYVVQCPGGNNDPLAVARMMRHGTIAVAADLPGEAFRLRQIETLDQLFASCPAKLFDRHGNIRRAHASGRLAAARAVTMTKAHKRRAYLIPHRFAQATSSQCLFGHDCLQSFRQDPFLLGLRQDLPGILLPAFGVGKQLDRSREGTRHSIHQES
jgi:hypothetical protein